MMTLAQRRRAFQQWLGRKALWWLSLHACRLPEAWVPGFGDWVGDTIRRISRRHWRLVLTNMNIAFGKEKTPEELEQLAYAAYHHAGRSLVEFLRMHRMSREKLLATANLVGTEHFDQALAQGKGLILLTAHYGNWELGGARIVAAGYPMNVIARNQSDPKVTDLLMGQRLAVGMKVIDRDRGAAGAIRALRRNEIVAILLDQNASTNGVFVDFFGKQAATAAGPAGIARKAGSPVVPIFAVRNPDNTHTGFIQPPLQLEYTEDKQADIVRNTQIMVKVIEEQIRRRPELWFWMHRRWKKRPPDEEVSPYG